MTPQQIDSILPYLEVFEKHDFVPGDWVKPEGPEWIMPMFVFGEATSDFHQTLYDNGWIDDSFNWPEWQEMAQQYMDSPDMIESADVESIQKLLMTHVRAERFCEGHLAAMFENGHIVALLRRLSIIRQTQEQSR